jgi:hypothetical protein
MKHAALCLACEQTMPSGSAAVLFEVGQIETHKKGGHSVFIAESWDMYFHTGCVSEFIDDKEHEITQEPSVCNYCGFSITPDSGHNKNVGRLSQYGKVVGDLDEGEESRFVESKTEPIEDVYICKECILDRLCTVEEIAIYMEEMSTDEE